MLRSILAVLVLLIAAFPASAACIIYHSGNYRCALPDPIFRSGMSERELAQHIAEMKRNAVYHKAWLRYCNGRPGCG